MDESAKRPTRFLIGVLWLLWACGSAHDRSGAQAEPDDPEPGAGSAGAGPNKDADALSRAGAFDAGSAPDRNAVTPGTICRRLAEIQCEAERICCDAPQRDRASCMRAIESSCTDDAQADRVAARREAGFDPVRAEQVFAELERLASACDPSVAAYGESLMGLRSMFAGTIDAGGSCTPAVVLDKAHSAAALLACRDAERQACLPALAAWRCAPIAGERGACFTDTNCEPGLFCDNPQLALSGGACTARKANGSGCALDNECQSSFCVDGACVRADRHVVYCPR